MEQPRFTPAVVLARNTLLNLVGMVLPILVGVIAIPYSIKGLSTEGFGVFSIVWVIIGYFSLLDFGISRATTKFVAEILGAKQPEKLPQVFWTASAINVIVGCAGTVVVLLVTPYLVDHVLNISPAFVPQAKHSFYISAFALPVILISTSWRGVLSAAQRFDLVNLVFVPANILSFAIPALSYFFGFDIFTVVALIILVRVISSFCYFYLCKKIFPFIGTKPIIDRDLRRKFLSYGGWVTITSVLSPILVYIDRFFIGSILSVSVVAYYTAPCDAMNRLRILPVALMNTLFPEFSMLSDGDEKARVETLFIRSVKYILLLTGLVSILLFCYAHEILNLWLGVEFADKASTVLRFFALGIVINSLAFVPFSLLQSIGRPDLPAKFHMVEFLPYILMLWLFTDKYGITGTALVWLLRIVVDFVLLYHRSWRLYPGVVKSLGRYRIWHELMLLLGLGAILLTVKLLHLAFMEEVLFITVPTLTFTLLAWFVVLDHSEKGTLTSFSRGIFSKGSLKDLGE